MVPCLTPASPRDPFRRIIELSSGGALQGCPTSVATLRITRTGQLSCYAQDQAP